SAQVDADVEHAVQHAEGCEDASTHAYVLAFAGGALFCSRSIDAACRRFEQAVEVCEANGLAFQLPAAHASPGLWGVWTGRLDRSRRHARRAVELSRRVGRSGWEVFGLAGLGAAAVLQGNHVQAQDWLSSAQAVLQRHGLEGTQYDLHLRPWHA